MIDLFSLDWVVRLGRFGSFLVLSFIESFQGKKSLSLDSFVYRKRIAKVKGSAEGIEIERGINLRIHFCVLKA